MVLSNIGYSLREAFRHMRRNWTTCFGAIVTIFLSLFIIGLFVFGSELLTNMVGGVEDKVTIQAFLSDDADRTQVDALQEKIRNWNDVDNVSYKSKEQALEEYKQTMSNKNAADAVAALDGQNPVPASLVIRLDEPQHVEEVATKLMNDSDFVMLADQGDPSSAVQYGQATVEKLFSVTSYIRIIMIVLVALLAFVAFVFINNTIRLAIAARQREIGIMKLVGASNGFIRGPFIMEGALEALLGALLAVGALQAIRTHLLPRLANSLQFLTFAVSDAFFIRLFVLLVAVGIVMGIVGSAIAMRRFLRV
ncbi:MAG: permease-like cell division protein FtsX [Atopobiaceae bacterium]|nr:permease-like cell division protein FtsX [Atopobiaceae bacterium]